MRAPHWAAFGLFLSSVATLLNAFPSYGAAVHSTAFGAGVLMALGSTLVAMFSQKPILSEPDRVSPAKAAQL